MAPTKRAQVTQAMAYLLVVAALAIFYAAVSYHAYQSFTYYPNGGWYGELARAFHQGDVALLSKPSPELLADPNPYAPTTHYPYKLDISFFHGKYYLYFGPAPVILFFYPWLLLTGQVLNQALVYWFISITGVIFFGLFLAAVVRLYYPAASLLVQVLILLLFGLGCTQAFCIHFVLVYHISAICAFTFILAMFYAIFLAQHSKKRKLLLLVLAGLCWGLAVGSRASTIIYGMVFLPVFYEMWKRQRTAPWLGSMFLIALPGMVIGLALAWYNDARFGHALDFGLTYQLSEMNYQTEPRFSLKNGLIGLPDMVLMTPRMHTDFPFFFAEPPAPGRSMFNPHRFSGAYIGLVFILPILFYGLLWSKYLKPPFLRKFALWLTISGAVMLVLVSCYFTICYRYYIDFFAPFFMLIALSMLAYTDTARKASGRRWLFWGATAWSLYMGLALSLIGEFNGIRNLHTYPPPRQGELWLPDGEITPPRH